MNELFADQALIEAIQTLGKKMGRCFNSVDPIFR
jgi:hypothetical protein